MKTNIKQKANQLTKDMLWMVYDRLQLSVKEFDHLNDILQEQFKKMHNGSTKPADIELLKKWKESIGLVLDNVKNDIGNWATCGLDHDHDTYPTTEWKCLSEGNSHTDEG